MPQKNIQIQIAAVLTIIGVAIAIGAAVSYYNQNELERNIEKQLIDQRDRLYTLSEITDSNGADTTVSTIIIDCPQRVKYESLLINLNTLTKKELLSLQSFSENCSKFFPNRKAAMVAKFERELKNYSDLIELMKILNTDNIDHYELSKWSEIVSLEVTRSDLLKEQNNIQSKIIILLIKGDSPDSIEILNLVKKAQNINKLLTISDVRIDEIRTLIIH